MQTQPCNSYCSIVLLCFAFWLVCLLWWSHKYFVHFQGPVAWNKGFSTFKHNYTGQKCLENSYFPFLLTGDDTLIVHEEHLCSRDKTFQILGRSLKLKCSSSERCYTFVYSFSAKLMLTCAVLFDHFKRLAYHSLTVVCPSDRSLGH